MSQFYIIDARASAFSSDSYLQHMAHKGLVPNEPSYRKVAVVPREGDVFAVGALDLVVSQVVNILNAKEGVPVARVWFKVKP